MVKIIDKMRTNPRGDWTIANLLTVAAARGVKVCQGKGSHVVFSFAVGKSLAVPAKRPNKPFYITAFLRLLDEP